MPYTFLALLHCPINFVPGSTSAIRGRDVTQWLSLACQGSLPAPSRPHLGETKHQLLPLPALYPQTIHFHQRQAALGSLDQHAMGLENWPQAASTGFSAWTTSGRQTHGLWIQSAGHLAAGVCKGYEDHEPIHRKLWNAVADTGSGTRFSNSASAQRNSTHARRP